MAPRGTGGTCPPNPKSRQKLSKKNGVKLVGYIFRLKNYVKIPPPFLLDFSELAPPLGASGRNCPSLNDENPAWCLLFGKDGTPHCDPMAFFKQFSI